MTLHSICSCGSSKPGFRLPKKRVQIRPLKLVSFEEFARQREHCCYGCFKILRCLFTLLEELHCTICTPIKLPY